MQPGPVIFLPDSVTRSQLRNAEISDYGSYIKVKSPFHKAIAKET